MESFTPFQNGLIGFGFGLILCTYIMFRILRYEKIQTQVLVSANQALRKQLGQKTEAANRYENAESKSELLLKFIRQIKDSAKFNDKNGKIMRLGLFPEKVSRKVSLCGSTVMLP